MMEKVVFNELGQLHDDSQKAIDIVDFEYLTVQDGLVAIREGYRALKNGGTLDFCVLNWDWIRDFYSSTLSVDASLSALIYTDGRKAIWGELFLVKNLLETGFYKVWTGITANRHPSIMGATALKMIESGGS